MGLFYFQRLQRHYVIEIYFTLISRFTLILIFFVNAEPFFLTKLFRTRKIYYLSLMRNVIAFLHKVASTKDSLANMWKAFVFENLEACPMFAFIYFFNDISNWYLLSFVILTENIFPFSISFFLSSLYISPKLFNLFFDGKCIVFLSNTMKLHFLVSSFMCSQSKFSSGKTAVI